MALEEAKAALEVASEAQQTLEPVVARDMAELRARVKTAGFVVFHLSSSLSAKQLALSLQLQEFAAGGPLRAPSTASGTQCYQIKTHQNNPSSLCVCGYS
jgi:hypothetical protein